MTTPACEPPVSVLMTVFNGQRYLTETIESILAQDMPDFEFVIVDDGSTDASGAILKRFAAGDRRIVLHTQANAGLVAALNTGLNLCRGRYVAITDHDDISTPGRLRRQCRHLDDHPHVVCVGGYAAMIDGKGRFLTVIELPTQDREIQQQNLQGHCSIYHSTAMYRREAVVSLGGYDAAYSYAQDLDLWLRLGEVGQLHNLPQRLGSYRLHNQGLSETRLEHQERSAKRACEQAWRRRGIGGVFKTTGTWRPTRDARSRLRFMLQYGWWAFNSGQWRTAMIYGLKAMRCRPLDRGAWNLFACAVLQRRRAQGAGA